MSIKQRVEKLERRHGSVGYCHVCRHHCGEAPSFVEVVEHGRGEPTGYFFDRGGKRYRYTVDPRPSCPVCGCRRGLLILEAFYGDPPPDLEKFLVCGADPVLMLGLNLDGTVGKLPADCRRKTASLERNPDDRHEP
jgi:hypothetical protein